VRRFEVKGALRPLPPPSGEVARRAGEGESFEKGGGALKLIEQYPEFLRNSPEFADLQAALQPEMDALRARLESMAEQLVLDTATWGLDLWEATLGLYPGRAMGLAARRARIAAKLRGTGTSTVEAVRQVVQSFTGGEVTVIEHAREFLVELKFSSENVLDLSQITAALREMLPAHLVFTMEFTAREARHILGWGTAAGSVGVLAGEEQARRPPPAETVFTGGPPGAVHLSQAGTPGAERSPAAQEVRAGGTGAVFRAQAGTPGKEKPPAARKVRTGGAGAVFRSQAGTPGTAKPPEPQKTRSGGVGTVFLSRAGDAQGPKRTRGNLRTGGAMTAVVTYRQA